MRRIGVILITALVLVGLLAVPVHAGETPEAEQQFLVVFADMGIPDGAIAEVEAAGGVVTRAIPQIGVLAVTADAGFGARAEAMSGVAVAGPDLMLSLDLPEMRIVHEDILVEGIEDNDLYLAYQWDIRRVGGDAETWAIQKGAGVTVAVLDTGVFADHPDIAPNYAYGRDFTDIAAPLPPGWIMWDLGGPQDYEGHGTHVAGAIAASIDSGRIIGVAPEASIASYKVMVAVLALDEVGYYATGIGYRSWIVDGIVTAAEDGVDVINMSLGGYTYMPDASDRAAFLAYSRAIEYAWDLGTLTVASSGNGAYDLVKLRPWFHVPSGAPKAVSVHATGPDDSLAFYSNYGPVDRSISAPGGDISAPVFSYCLSAYSPLNAWAPGAGWVFSIGTSMAAPKVSAVAALIYAQNPGIDPGGVYARLISTSERIGPNRIFGHGLVDAYAAVGG